jgi:hypothetical protein
MRASERMMLYMCAWFLIAIALSGYFMVRAVSEYRQVTQPCPRFPQFTQPFKGTFFD